MLGRRDPLGPPERRAGALQVLQIGPIPFAQPRPDTNRLRKVGGCACMREPPGIVQADCRAGGHYLRIEIVVLLFRDQRPRKRTAAVMRIA